MDQYKVYNRSHIKHYFLEVKFAFAFMLSFVFLCVNSNGISAENDIQLSFSSPDICRSIYENNLTEFKQLFKDEKELYSICLYLNKKSDKERLKFSSPLDFAVILDRRKILDWLIANDIQIEQPQNHVDYYKLKQHNHYLFKAIELGNLNLVLKYLNSGLNTNVLNSENQTFLEHAIRYNQHHLVDLFIEHKINVNHVSEDNESAISIALMNGNLELVEKLIQNGANIELAKPKLVETFSYNLVNKRLDAVKYILNNKNLVRQKTSFINSSDFLMIAAKNGAIESVQYLLENKADPNYISKKGQTPLSRIIECCYRFQKRHKNSSLFASHKEETYKVIMLLLKYGANPNVMINDGYQTPVILAVAEHNDFETVKLLHLFGGNLDSQDSFGDTALTYTSGNGHLKIVKYLLENGANIKLATHDGDTALHAAAERSQIEVFDYLLSQGFDLNQKNKFGQDALQSAKQYKQWNMVRHIEYLKSYQ